MIPSSLFNAVVGRVWARALGSATVGGNNVGNHSDSFLAHPGSDRWAEIELSKGELQRVG